MALLLPMVNPLRATVLTLVVIVAVFATNVLVWTEGNLVLPLASGLLMIAMLFALNMSYGFFVESRAKRQITGLFGQYVPPELVDEMSKDPESFSMEGESRELSVLFTDVRGFTTISEGLDPKELSQADERILDAAHANNLQASRHNRQVHGRLHHGLLGRSAQRSAARA